MPKKVVIDTNVYVSYLMASRSDTAVAQAVRYAHGRHHLYQSPETFAELEEVLARPKFARYFSPDAAQGLLDKIKASATFLEPTTKPQISPDPDDNKFFALAEAADADFLLSGDTKHVLTILDYRNAQTIAPVDFIDPRNRTLYFSHMASPARKDSGLFEAVIFETLAQD